MTGRLSRVMALVTPRTGAQVARFFDGLELVDPGIVPVNRWHPDPDTDTGRDFPMHCGVARKP